MYPASFRIEHYAQALRRADRWGQPFRTITNDLYWVVSFGEGHGMCGLIEFEDAIPPANYAGVESALGSYPGRVGCYGAQLTLNASLENANRTTSTPVSAKRRVVIRCAPFPPK